MHAGPIYVPPLPVVEEHPSLDEINIDGKRFQVSENSRSLILGQRRAEGEEEEGEYDDIGVPLSAHERALVMAAEDHESSEEEEPPPYSWYTHTHTHTIPSLPLSSSPSLPVCLCVLHIDRHTAAQESNGGGHHDSPVRRWCALS